MDWSGGGSRSARQRPVAGLYSPSGGLPRGSWAVRELGEQDQLGAGPDRGALFRPAEHVIGRRPGKLLPGPPPLGVLGWSLSRPLAIGTANPSATQVTITAAMAPAARRQLRPARAPPARLATESGRPLAAALPGQGPQHRAYEEGRAPGTRQLHAVFRFGARSPSTLLVTATPHGLPQQPEGYMEHFR